MTEVGSASKRKHFHCPKCGPWRDKNPAAVILGQLGGKAASAKLNDRERHERAKDAAKSRWDKAKLKDNVLV